MKVYSLLFCMALFTSCFKTSRDCKSYKNGAFTFNYTEGGKEKTSRFIRKDTLNINFYDNKQDSSRVRWINDCEYVLYKINPKSMSEKNPIHIKILSTTDSSYVFEYALVVVNQAKENKVRKGIAYKKLIR